MYATVVEVPDLLVHLAVAEGVVVGVVVVVALIQVVVVVELVVRPVFLVLMIGLVQCVLTSTGQSA